MAKQLQELHHELIDSLCASELHDFIHREMNGLETQLSSAVAKLILGGRRSGHYINVNVTSNKAGSGLYKYMYMEKEVQDSRVGCTINAASGVHHTNLNMV